MAGCLNATNYTVAETAPATDEEIRTLEGNLEPTLVVFATPQTIRSLLARIHKERETADNLRSLLIALYRECEAGADPFEAANISGRLLINRIKPFLSPKDGETGK